MNDEALMTNDERMTKSEGQNACAEDSFWDEDAGVVREEPEPKRVYDLEERTARLGEAVIDFARMAEARKLWLEARELHLIFAKIWRSGKNE